MIQLMKALAGNVEHVKAPCYFRVPYPFSLAFVMTALEAETPTCQSLQLSQVMY